MVFIKAKKWAFPPELYFANGDFISTVSEISLLGVIVTDNLKWSQNTKFICMKARKKTVDTQEDKEPEPYCLTNDGCLHQRGPIRFRNGRSCLAPINYKAGIL